MLDKATGRSRGFGFVNFQDDYTMNTVLSVEHRDVSSHRMMGLFWIIILLASSTVLWLQFPETQHKGTGYQRSVLISFHFPNYPLHDLQIC
jgi:hypothetical protein